MYSSLKVLSINAKSKTFYSYKSKYSTRNSVICTISVKIKPANVFDKNNCTYKALKYIYIIQKTPGSFKNYTTSINISIQ